MLENVKRAKAQSHENIAEEVVEDREIKEKTLERRREKSPSISEHHLTASETTVKAVPVIAVYLQAYLD